jgi:hypothetical protein
VALFLSSSREKRVQRRLITSMRVWVEPVHYSTQRGHHPDFRLYRQRFNAPTVATAPA